MGNEARAKTILLYCCFSKSSYRLSHYCEQTSIIMAWPHAGKSVMDRALHCFQWSLHKARIRKGRLATDFKAH